MRCVKRMKSLAKGIPLVEMDFHLAQNRSEAGPRAYGRTYDQTCLGTLGGPIRRDLGQKLAIIQAGLLKLLKGPSRTRFLMSDIPL
jgi:hypothetical protein